MDQRRTRREALCILGAAGATMLVGCGGTTLAGSQAPGTGGKGGGAGDGGPNPEASGTGGLGAGGAGTGGSTDGGAGAGGAGMSSGGTASGGGVGSGGGGVNAGAGGATGACDPKRETTVGPYPNVDPLARRDVRGNTSDVTAPKDGAELTLRIRVRDVAPGCAPIPGAVVDVWHCDATGVYAGYAAFGTTGQDFCRGYLTTDAEGVAEFLTIFPGSYAGRAIHIHFSIQGTETNLRPNDEGANLPAIFVAQLYFERAVADEIFAAVAIYRQGAPITPNQSDGIFVAEGGAGLIVSVTKAAGGYLGEIDVGVSRNGIGM
jgi:protocatechuate 3,4-dioxygenase beta subunit